MRPEMVEKIFLVPPFRYSSLARPSPSVTACPFISPFQLLKWINEEDPCTKGKGELEKKKHQQKNMNSCSEDDFVSFIFRIISRQKYIYRIYTHFVLRIVWHSSVSSSPAIRLVPPSSLSPEKNEKINFVLLPKYGFASIGIQNWKNGVTKITNFSHRYSAVGNLYS